MHLLIKEKITSGLGKTICVEERMHWTQFLESHDE